MFTDEDPGVQVDDSAFPLVVKRVGRFMGPSEMATFLNDFSKLLDRKQPFASIVIVRKRGKMNWSILEDWSRWLKTNGPAMREHCKGVAFVFPNEAFRVLMSAILSVSSVKVPHKVFSSQSVAYTWATAKLAPSGYKQPPVPPTLWP